MSIHQRFLDGGIWDRAIKNSLVLIPLSHSGIQSISGQAFSLLTPFASVHIGRETGQGPALKKQKMKLAGRAVLRYQRSSAVKLFAPSHFCVEFDTSP
jgi:hypothetical protein